MLRLPNLPPLSSIPSPPCRWPVATQPHATSPAGLGGLTGLEQSVWDHSGIPTSVSAVHGFAHCQRAISDCHKADCVGMLVSPEDQPYRIGMYVIFLVPRASELW